MSDFSSLTHKFRANLDNQPAGLNKISKRNRQPLSCAPCRLKKLKCDRGHPCETCIKRGDPSGCAYGKNAPAPSKTEANGANSKGKAQERLRHLEQLVMQMVDHNGSSSGQSEGRSAESSQDGSASSDTSKPPVAGHLQVGSSEARYVGSTHWSAILDNIQEIKIALGTDNTSSTDLDESEDAEAQEIETLFGTVGTLSLAQILSQALPPRLQVDRRLSTYFNSRYLIIPFVHTTQFQREYEQFWRNPLESPPLWVSILFSICCMSATLSQAVGSETSTPEDQPSPRMSFLNAACQCLRLGGYIRPKKWVVEALGLYSQCKYMATLDPSREVGMIFTLLIRLAYRSGYHRDPSQFPHISVFDGEMRRRTWAMCRQFDLMVSFQLGLPNLIPPHSWDTRLPRNLLDADFDEGSTVLPPSRPEHEPTQILYFIVKSRLMTAFGKICAHALSFRDCSKQEVMDLDNEVRTVHKTVPATLRMKPMSQSFADPSFLIMVRLNCEFLYQKCLLVLHRKYMTQGNHPESNEACMAAATAITECMLDIYKEFKPSGQLHADRWMLSSFTMNDFYLASMMLCLSISMWKKANPGRDVNENKEMKSRFELLVSAYGVCEESSATSTEAKRVAGVLSAVLGQYATAEARNTDSLLSDGMCSPEKGIAERRDKFRIQPTAFFPSGFDFNLGPLSLSDAQQPSEKSASLSQTSSVQPSGGTGTTTQSQPDVFNATNFDPFIYSPSFDMTQEQNARLGPNPFTAFLPFSLNYPLTPTPAPDPLASSASQPSTTATSANPNQQNQNTASSFLNVDVDWAFLDQWMALPNPDLIPPLPNNPSSLQPKVDSNNQNNTQNNLPPEVPTTTSASFSDINTDWTSTPYRFWGADTLLHKEQQKDIGISAPQSQPAGGFRAHLDPQTSQTTEMATANTSNHDTSPGTDGMDYTPDSGIAGGGATYAPSTTSSSGGGGGGGSTAGRPHTREQYPLY